MSIMMYLVYYHIYINTLIISMTIAPTRGYRFSSGSSSLASGNLIPTNRSFLLNISLCLAVKFPISHYEHCELTMINDQVTETFNDQVYLINIRVTGKQRLSSYHLTEHTAYCPHINCPNLIRI